MVDNATRLDTTYVTGNKFVYKYTLINHNVAELDIQVFHQAMLNQVTGFVCSSPDMVFFVDNKIDVGYHYVDKNEQFISEAVVITANCQK